MTPEGRGNPPLTSGGWVFRRLKNYLWTKVPHERYRRCSECQELVRVFLQDESFDMESLKEHPGHRLNDLRWVSLTEWFRVVRG